MTYTLAFMCNFDERYDDEKEFLTLAFEGHLDERYDGEKHGITLALKERFPDLCASVQGQIWSNFLPL